MNRPHLSPTGPAEAPGKLPGPLRRSVAIVPTLCTLGNALCGFLAVFLASRGPQVDLPLGLSALTIASIFIFLGMLFDGFDGQIARLTRSTSDLGEQLDSMADMVTFGVAPAFIAVQLAGVQSPFLSLRGDRYFDRAALIIACIYVACAALRLARFNVEANQHQAQAHAHAYFSGLPSPGAAGTVAGLVMLHQHLLDAIGPLWVLKTSAVGILAVMILVAWAMVSRLPYVHVPNRYLRGKAPFGYFVMAVVVILLLLIAPQWSIAMGFTAYALSAPVMLLPVLRHWVPPRAERSGEVEIGE
ncbi:MAG: CDP-diacylglycerol--serine O-phosphatidyltransferase [Phycisphaeraceae bacterium]|nr:CDP-diacylglycerol--serine O-phosphatidyltransferase [Phycisphaeraceae bacterium]